MTDAQKFHDEWANLDTPRTADADDLALAAKTFRYWHSCAVGDEAFVDGPCGCEARVERFSASARLRPLEDVVLEAAEAWATGHDCNLTRFALIDAVRALKDARSALAHPYRGEEQ